MKKKQIILIAIIGLFLLGLIGCGAEKQSQDFPENVSEVAPLPASGNVDLKVFCDENSVDLMNEVISSFKSNYEGQADFNIEIVVGDESMTKNSIIPDVNNAPDVFVMPDDQMNILIGTGILSPVQNQDEIAAANVEGSVEAATYNDTMYAYPLTADNGYFMYYNKDFFTENDVQKLSDMFEIASQNGKKVTFDMTSAWYTYTFFGNTGLTLKLSDDGITNLCDWNSTENEIKGIDVAKAMMEIGKNPGYMCGNDAELLAGLEDGSVIAGVSGVWNASKVKELLGDKYAATKLPTYTCAGKEVQMASFTGYKLVGVNYYSKNVEWAHKFAQWMTNEENQTLRFVMRTQGPSNINAGNSDEVQKEPAIVAVINQSQFGTLQRVGSFYWDPVNRLGTKLLNETLSDEELQIFLDQTVEEITASGAK